MLFDSYHHSLLNRGEPMRSALLTCAQTWRKSDGAPMVDYSHEQAGRRRGAHAETLDQRRFRRFLNQVRGIPCDVMLEIKDKERSARAALRVFSG